MVHLPCKPRGSCWGTVEVNRRYLLWTQLDSARFAMTARKRFIRSMILPWLWALIAEQWEKEKKLTVKRVPVSETINISYPLFFTISSWIEHVHKNVEEFQHPIHPSKILIYSRQWRRSWVTMKMVRTSYLHCCVMWLTKPPASSTAGYPFEVWWVPPHCAKYSETYALVNKSLTHTTPPPHPNEARPITGTQQHLSWMHCPPYVSEGS